MKLVVCVKQVLDPEIPPQHFKIDTAACRAVDAGMKMVIDSYAENALEVAIQLRERTPDTHVTVLCIGDKRADEVLRRALGMTADEAVRIWDADWMTLDAHAIAHVLARGVAKLGGADLVLTGREASDIERGLVPGMLAEELGAACVTMVVSVERRDSGLRMRTATEAGYAIVGSILPVVLSVTNDTDNVPRIPKIRDLMAAARKPIRSLGKDDLELDSSRMAARVALRRLVPVEQESNCELIAEADGPASANELARRLHEMKVLSAVGGRA